MMKRMFTVAAVLTGFGLLLTLPACEKTDQRQGTATPGTTTRTAPPSTSAPAIGTTPAATSTPVAPTTAPAAPTAAPAATPGAADAGSPGIGTNGATTNGAPTGGADAGGGLGVTTAILASADAYDGAVDKTVSKCLMCGLRMDGVAEHAQTHAGYTFHFCSAECAKAFAEKPDAVIAKLEVPS